MVATRISRVAVKLLPTLVSVVSALVACSTSVRADSPPGRMSYVQWEFAQDAVRSIEFEVNIENDPHLQVGAQRADVYADGATVAKQLRRLAKQIGRTLCLSRQNVY